MAKTYDFKQMSNILFSNKSLYPEVDDESKEENFFIINRKLSYMFPKQACFLNHKTTDPVIAMDLWFFFLKSKNINYPPKWWFGAKANYGKKSKNVSKDYLPILENEDLREEDIFFLEKYFKDDLTNEAKKIKRFD